MKSLSFILLILTVLSLHAGDDKTGIYPRVTKKFGDVILVKVAFVAKPNSYYAQNIVKTSCYAMIIELNGEKLANPVVMEYQSSVDFKEGSEHILTAFEDLSSSGANREWDGQIRQFNYGISQFIRLKAPESNKPKNNK